jgi:hypothetical protein
MTWNDYLGGTQEKELVPNLSYLAYHLLRGTLKKNYEKRLVYITQRLERHEYVLGMSVRPSESFRRSRLTVIKYRGI